MNDRMVIQRAGPEHLDAVAPLFDAYRQFYRQPADLESARRFLRDRFASRDSVVFLALCPAASIMEPAGFTQLYPSATDTGH